MQGLCLPLQRTTGVDLPTEGTAVHLSRAETEHLSAAPQFIQALQQRRLNFQSSIREKLAAITNLVTQSPSAEASPTRTVLTDRVTAAIAQSQALGGHSFDARLKQLGELLSCHHLSLKLSATTSSDLEENKIRAAHFSARCQKFERHARAEAALPFLSRLKRWGVQGRYEKLSARAAKSEQAANNKRWEAHEDIADLDTQTRLLQRTIHDVGSKIGHTLSREIISHFAALERELAAEKITLLLNERLIEKRLLPAIKNAEEAGQLDPACRGEIFAYARAQLAEQGPPHDSGSPERRLKDFNELASRIGEASEVESVLRNVSLEHYINSPFPRNFYAPMYTLLCASAASRAIDEVAASLSRLNVMSNDEPDFRRAVERASRETGFRLTMPSEREAKNLKGIERWEIIKTVPGLPQLFGQEGFERTEVALVTRLFEEDLLPGGAESLPGTAAVGMMAQFGNPAAIPCFMAHLKRFGSGHTSALVAGAMVDMWRDLAAAENSAAIPKLSPTEREFLRVLCSPDARINRDRRPDGYTIAHLAQNASAFLARERLASLLERGGAVSEEEISQFYSGFKNDSPKIVRALLSSRAEVEREIAESKLDFWSEGQPSLIAALVDPRRGIVTLPRRITEEGLHIQDLRLLGKVDAIVGSASFAKNGFDRKGIAEGLLYLNARQDGALIAADLLERYRGAKDDQKRLRRVFQFLQALGMLGEAEYPSTDSQTLQSLEDGCKEARERQLSLNDKEAKRQARADVARLTTAIDNLTGLKGIEDTLTDKLVRVAMDRLHLKDASLQHKLQENLEPLLREGFFEVVFALLGRYEEKSLPKVISTLQLISEHVVRGDFEDWKFKNPLAERQLAHLTPIARQTWSQQHQPVVLSLEDASVQGTRVSSRLEAVQFIIRDAEQHILEESSKSTDAEVTKCLEFFRALTAETFSESEVLAEAARLAEALGRAQLHTARLDIEQIAKVFKERATTTVIAAEVRDAMGLLKVGTEPQETCQSWRRGSFNECLLAYVADGNKKAINVSEQNGQPILRGIVKVTKMRSPADNDGRSEETVLFLEKPYVMLSEPQVVRAYFRLAIEKARDMKVVLALGYELSPGWAEIVAQEAKRAGYVVQPERHLAEFHIPVSHNQFEYSDSLGGKISLFDNYRRASVTLLRPEKL